MMVALNTYKCQRDTVHKKKQKVTENDVISRISRAGYHVTSCLHILTQCIIYNLMR